MKDNIRTLKDAIEVQGQKGNWTWDPYMHGMFNGMEFARAVIEENEPKYKEAPLIWGKHKSKIRYFLSNFLKVIHEQLLKFFGLKLSP